MDMVTVRGVFTQEANKEAEKIMYSPKNILNILGGNIRTVEKEAIQTIYQLTKE